MLSDVLSYAGNEIDRYLREFPRAYTSEILDEILEVRNAMEELRSNSKLPPRYKQ